MKTHVITFSKFFPKGHPREGAPTLFREKIFDRSKLHTIRTNFDWWAERITDVQEGRAVLSLREWSGMPYRSKQVEFQRVTADNRPGFQKIWVPRWFDSDLVIDGERWGRNLLASNDGLSIEDFNEWFRDRDTDGIIVHLTDFRYKI